MGKSIVKRYLKSVNDENLPLYGKASISLLETTGSSYAFFIISSSGVIHVSSRVPFLPYGASEKVTSETVNSGAVLYFTIDVSDIPSTDYLENIVEIDNIYNCSCFAAYHPGNYSSALSAAATLRNNLKSMWKCAPLEIAGISRLDVGADLNDSVYYLTIEDQAKEFLDLSKYLALPNIELITGGLGGLTNSVLRVSLQESNRDSKLSYLFASYSGSKVEHLPYMLRFTYTYGLEGNIEDYVTMARDKGREEGVLVFGNAGAATDNLKYQDTDFKTLWDNNTVPHITVSGASDIACLSWGQSTMEWLNSVPEGYLVKCVSPSVYRAQHNS